MREHGTRTKYMHDGCRWFPWRPANAGCGAARGRGRSALGRRKEAGAGPNPIAKAVPMSRTRLQEIYHNRGARPDRPDRRKLRRETAERILKVWPDPPGAAVVDAGAPWRLLNELLAAGYPKAHVAQALGKKMPALQIQKQCGR